MMTQLLKIKVENFFFFINLIQYVHSGIAGYSTEKRRKVGLVSFLSICYNKKPLLSCSTVAPIITPNLSGVWVDGCADLALPGTSLTVVIDYALMMLFGHMLIVGEKI